MSLENITSAQLYAKMSQGNFPGYVLKGDSQAGTVTGPLVAYNYTMWPSAITIEITSAYNCNIAEDVIRRVIKRYDAA